MRRYFYDNSWADFVTDDPVDAAFDIIDLRKPATTLTDLPSPHYSLIVEESGLVQISQHGEPAPLEFSPFTVPAGRTVADYVVAFRSWLRKFTSRTHLSWRLVICYPDDAPLRMGLLAYTDRILHAPSREIGSGSDQKKSA